MRQREMPWRMGVSVSVNTYLGCGDTRIFEGLPDSPQLSSKRSRTTWALWGKSRVHERGPGISGLKRKTVPVAVPLCPSPGSVLDPAQQGGAVSWACIVRGSMVQGGYGPRRVWFDKGRGSRAAV